MKKWHFFLAGLALMAACTEKTDLRSDGEYNEYLVVDATLTDQAGVPQQVMLSRTVPYFSDGQEQAAAAVRGASVTVADEEETVRFSEQQPGVYVAPEGYHAEYGRNYRLRIEEGGTIYEAEATMPESGFRLDEIDYAWAGNKSMGVDSLWTVAIWGKDQPQTSFYYVTIGVNDRFYPFELSEVLDDKYFNGNIVTGFPITTLMQVSFLQKRYGDCCKYLEKGDVITLQAHTLAKDYFDYLLSVTLNSSLSSIPLFSPQPANCPTNIRGENVVGYFAVTPVVSASVTVDDPQRPYYKKLLPKP